MGSAVRVGHTGDMQSVQAPVPHDWTTELLRMQRTPGQRSWTGVSRMIGARTGLDPLLVRCLFILLTASGGLGAIAYLFLVALTTDASAGRAPLDRLGSGWRRQSSQSIVGGAIALTVVASVGVGLVLQTWMGLSSLLVLAATVLIGQRARSRVIHPDMPAAPVHARAVLGVGIATCFASLTAMALLVMMAIGDEYVGLGVGLIIIAAGLGICAWLGSSRLLIAAGVMFSLVIGTAAMTARVPSTSSSENTIGVSAQYELHDQTLDSVSLTYDLSALTVTTDQVWRIDATDSAVQLILPSDQNIDLDIDYHNSTLNLPYSFVLFGSGSYAPGPNALAGGPELKVHIVVDSSSVTVVQP